jgi:hypothetical protein
VVGYLHVELGIKINKTEKSIVDNIFTLERSQTEVKISMKKKYSASLYFKLLKSYPNKYIYN